MPTRLEIEEDRAKYIEHMLMYLGLYTRSFGCPDPMFFDDAMPAYHSMLKYISANTGQNNREMDEKAASLSKIEGIAMFTGAGLSHDGFTLIGCRPLSFQARKRLFFAGGNLFKPPPGYHAGPKSRNIITPLSPILQVRKVVVDVNGHAVASSPGYMVKSAAMGDKWVQLMSGEMTDNGTPLAWMGFSLAVGISMTAATDWSIGLRFDQTAPGLRLITDPTGIRDFFRFRDIPEGKVRRSALVNWVHEHWRVSRHSPEDEVYVREHLRGAREFAWHGLSGAVHIPEVDVKREEEAKAKRKRMPAAEAIRRSKLKR